jgi:hypothetical protein
MVNHGLARIRRDGCTGMGQREGGGKDLGRPEQVVGVLLSAAATAVALASSSARIV